MDFFPVFLDVSGQPVLVLGEGEAAERKAELVARAGAEVRRATSFSPALLDDCRLAIGAGAAEADVWALVKAARGRGIPVNVVDRPELCTAIMPAIVERGPISIAISSGGRAPVLARLLRTRIEALVPAGFGRLAALAGRLREETVLLLPDARVRRRWLERVFSGRVAERVFAGDEAGAEAEYRKALAHADSEPGMVFFIVATEVDLLTLRAARLIGEADTIVHDPDASNDVLQLGRRDAERIVAGNDAANQLIPLARTGRKVMRILKNSACAEQENEVLAREGIDGVTIPVANTVTL